MSQPSASPPPGADPPPGRPGRYQRSFSGLVGAMIILVLVVLAIVGYRALFRTELEVDPQAVDFRAAGEAVAGAGLPAVLPVALPDGWIATTAELEPGRTPVWRMGVLTAEERFVGLRQAELPAEELLEETYPDEEPVELEPVVIPGAVAVRWQAWDVGARDLAWAAEVGDATVLVHGSAPPADLKLFVATLEQLTPDDGPLAGADQPAGS